MSRQSQMFCKFQEEPAVFGSGVPEERREFFQESRLATSHLQRHLHLSGGEERTDLHSQDVRKSFQHLK